MFYSNRPFGVICSILAFLITSLNYANAERYHNTKKSLLKYKYGLGLVSEQRHIESLDFRSNLPHETDHEMTLFGIEASMHAVNVAHYRLGVKWLHNQSNYHNQYLSNGIQHNTSFEPETQALQIIATLGYDLTPRRVIKAHLFSGIMLKQMASTSLNNTPTFANDPVNALLNPLSIKQTQWFIPLGVRAKLLHTKHWKFKTEFCIKWLIQGTNKQQQSFGPITYRDHKGYELYFGFPTYYQTNSKTITVRITPYFNLAVIDKEPQNLTYVYPENQVPNTVTLSNQYNEHTLGLLLAIQFN
jgi:hypothetical protein